MYEFVAGQVVGINGLINLSNIVFLVAFSVRDVLKLRIEDYARNHPFSYDKEELPDLLPYIRRHHADAAIDAWLDKFVTRTAPIPTGQLLMTLNEAVAQSFSYKRRSSRGTQTPAETIMRQEGTCRDFALLMMEAARSLGFAARFVTGYVYVPDRDGPLRLGGGSTHAWCQVYVPGSGWVEFDPTNGIVGNRDLIRVGVSRTPAQAVPLSGSFYPKTYSRSRLGFYEAIEIGDGSRRCLGPGSMNTDNMSASSEWHTTSPRQSRPRLSFAHPKSVSGLWWRTRP